MKKTLSLALAFVLCLSLCACGSKKPSGKYYWETSSEAYYQFEGNNKCYLYINGGQQSCEYLYTINENDDPEGVFVIHITDVNSSASHKLIYDANKDSIWDPDLGNFTKK